MRRAVSIAGAWAVALAAAMACSSYESNDASPAPDAGEDVAATPPPPPPPEDAGDAGTRAFHRLIHVQAGDAGVLAGYAVRVPLDVDALAGSGKTRSDFDDLHVFGVTGERDRVIDHPPSMPSSAIWFALRAPLAAGASEDYDLRYGAAGGAKRDGHQVFFVWEDGDSPPVFDAWTKGGYASVDGGAAFLDFEHGGSPSATMLSTAVPAAHCVLEVRAQISLPSQAENFYWGFDNAAAGVTFIGIERGSALGTVAALATTDVCPGACTGASKTIDSAPHVYRVARDVGLTRFAIDDTTVATITTSSSEPSLPIVLANASTTVGAAVTITLARVRPLAPEEPVVTLGDEQSLP